MPWALLWTIGSFALILLLARLKVPLSAAIFIGVGVLAYVFGSGPIEIGQIFWQGTIDPSTIALMIIVAMLLTLSELMRTAGQLQEIVSLARVYLRRPAVAIAAMPVLIGLIPMPGGALFSASMVKSAAGEVEISGGRLSAINYWFRHIWEYWWPLYPAVLVATEQANMDVGTIALFHSPLTIFAVLGGLVIFRKTHPELHATAARPPAGTGRKLLVATSSIWVIVLAYAATKGLLAAISGKPAEPLTRATLKFLPVALGLVVSILWTSRMHRIGPKAILRILAGKTVYAMVILVIAVMVFQFTLNRVDAASRIAEDLQHLHVPILLVVGLLPFIAGLVTGLGVGFVGASFPIVLPLVKAIPNHGQLPPYVMLAFACGHLGMMLSPMHLCHVVSNRYFNTSFSAVYRRIIPAGIITLLLAAVYFVVLRLIMG